MESYNLPCTIKLCVQKNCESKPPAGSWVVFLPHALIFPSICVPPIHIGLTLYNQEFGGLYCLRTLKQIVSFSLQVSLTLSSETGWREAEQERKTFGFA